MAETGLLPVCGIAFLAVFFLLAILAAAMQLITALFPGLRKALDPAVVAAISSTVSTLYAGSRVTEIQEEKS